MLLTAIDIGGTFTDGIVVDENDTGFGWTKVPSTPQDLGQGFLNCLDRLLSMRQAAYDAVAYLAHGSTVVINALIEGKVARTGLLTTEGFRDVLEIGRGWRGKHLYEMLTYERPRPLVPRDCRLSVTERVDYSGRVIRDLDEEGARRAIRHLKDKRVEAIAIGLLHAYANPLHERRLRALAREEYPDVYMCLSSEVCREFREYERLSTTALNACLMPLVARYLERLQTSLERTRASETFFLMASNGGVMPPEVAANHPVRMVNSGVAAGVMAGTFFGGLAGYRNLITIDMGGTSFDVGLVEGGEPRIVPEAEIQGHALRLPMVDVSSIGAGGGSIARIDRGGFLQVGPQSAGAEPGPACYGKGGNEPTVTDAHLVLGRLDPNSFLGGVMTLDSQEAKEAIGRTAATLGLSLEEAAIGIIEVVNANMARAIQAVSLERGHDPREFTLIAMGGAGPLHALELAEEMAMSTVIVPAIPGCASALGLLASNLRHDHVATYRASVDRLNLEHLNGLYRELEAEAMAWLPTRLREKDILISRSIDLRYVGQGFEVAVPLGRFPVRTAEVHRLTKEFHRVHRRFYGYAAEEEGVEIVAVRLTLALPLEKPKLPLAIQRGGTAKTALVGERPVVYRRRKFARCPVYVREGLVEGDVVEGPAIIQQVDSTAAIIPGYAARVDAWGNLIVKAGVASGRRSDHS